MKKTFFFHLLLVKEKQNNKDAYCSLRHRSGASAHKNSNTFPISRSILDGRDLVCRHFKVLLRSVFQM